MLLVAYEERTAYERQVDNERAVAIRGLGGNLGKIRRCFKQRSALTMLAGQN